MASKDYTLEEYSAQILPCPKCGCEDCDESGEEESVIVCPDCDFEVVTNNVAKSKKKWNKIKRGTSQ